MTLLDFSWGNVKIAFFSVRKCSSAQFLDQVGHRGDMSSSCMGRDVHSLMLFIQCFLCWSWRRPPSKVPCRMGLERLPWHVTFSNHASFHLLTVARRGSCGPMGKLISLRTQSLGLRSKEMERSFFMHLVLKALTLCDISIWQKSHSPLLNCWFLLLISFHPFWGKKIQDPDKMWG